METKSKSLFFLFLFLSACSANKNEKAINFSLKGRLVDQDTGIIVLRYAPKSSWVFDTANIENGKFLFQGDIIEPTRATLLMGNQQAEFYLDPAKMEITLKNEKFADFELSGSKTQTEEDIMNEMVKPVNEKLDLWRQKRKDISDSIKNTTDDLSKKTLESELNTIDNQWILARKDLDQTWLKFVLENPKSYVSPYYLNILVGNNVLSLDSMNLVFNALDSTIQNSKYGNMIREKIKKKENTRIGESAPDFKANDINNKVVTLSEFKDKSILLLDFWASWCVPCRQNIPFLKTLYKEYHSKGFEIISVSVDTNKEAWLKAISEEGIDIWFNIPVAEKYAAGPNFITKDDIYFNYDVGAIPDQLLIDRNGKIIGRWIGNSDENNKSLKAKLEELISK